MSDSGVRDRIRKETDKNFFVEAGAGSGKTSMLVDRLVAMVESGTPIEKICAITFTKAAANEFYSRFQEKLSQSKSEIAKRTLQDIDLCFMGTIDSFCNMALSEHPVEAMVPSGLSLVSEDDLLEEYRRFFAEIPTCDKVGLRDKYNRAVEMEPKSAGKIFEKSVAALMSMRHVDFHYNPPKVGTLDDIYAAEIKRVREIIKYLEEHPEAKYTGKDDKGWDGLVHFRAEVEKNWNDNVYNLSKSYKDNDIGKLKIDPNYDMDLFGSGWEEFFDKKEKTTKARGYEIEYYMINQEQDPFLIQRAAEQKYSVMIDLAFSSIDLIQEKLKREGKLSYFDYLLYFRDMLKEDIAKGGNVIKHLSERHRYFLIDEFQDTNPLQAEIFFYLSAKEPKENWIECEPREGSLFVVGDPKQSIYRFRNADIESYKTVKALFESGVGEVVELTSNFRSTPALKGWFNDVFEDMLVESDIQAGFSPMPDATGYHAPFTGILDGVYKYRNEKVLDVNENDHSLLTSEVGDEEKVSEIIKTLVENEKIKITVKQKTEKGEEVFIDRTIAYKDIMILTRTTTGIKDLMKEFKREGIPFRVAGDVLFAECPALKTLVYLMKDVAYNSYNSKDNKRYDNDKKTSFFVEKLSDVSYDIKEYHKKEITPSALFALLLDKEKVIAKSGVENLEYLYYAEELLRAREIDGSVYSLKSAVDFLEGLLEAGKKETERALQLDPSQNAVYLANLHKVKGLEAPIVILAHPNKQSRGPALRITQKDGYLFSVQEKSQNNENVYSLIETLVFNEEKEEEKEVLSAEEDRLLYVAATRAMNALIVASKTNKPKNGVAEESKTNPWAVLASEIEEDITTSVLYPCRKLETDVEQVSIDAEEVDNLYKKAIDDSCIEEDKKKRKEQNAPTFKLEKPSTIKKSHSKSQVDNSEVDDSLEEEASETSAPKEESEEKKERKQGANVIGTMVHRFMEIMVSSKAAVDVNQAIKSIILEQKDNFSAGEDYYKDILKEVSETIVNKGGYTQESDVPQDILTTLINAEDVYCEFPFCYCEDSSEEKTIWNGVMDVVYRDDNGWHILDYKTNRDTKDLDAKFEEQLNAYKVAFKEITGETADAKIYSIPV